MELFSTLQCSLPGTHRQSVIEAPLGAECHSPKQDGKGPAVKLMTGGLRRKLTVEYQIIKRVVNPYINPAWRFEKD